MIIDHPHPSPNRFAAISLALRPFAVGVVFTLTSLVAAHAQSLQDLYEAAKEYDATFMAARSLAQSAQFKAAQADALRRPSATLTGSARHFVEELPLATSTDSDSTSLLISGKYPLFNGSSNAFIDQAYKALEVAKHNFKSAEQDLIVRVAQAYFDVLTAQDTLSTARANRAGISEQLASAKRNFEVGTATITDTREAQARFDLATAQEIAADNELLTTRIALDQVVGRRGVRPFPLATPIALPALNPINVDAWITTADAEHPAVRGTRLAFEVAKLETQRGRADHLPTLDVVASASKSHSNAGTVNSLAGTTKSNSVGVELNLPLFSGFQTVNRVKESLLLEEKARNDLEIVRRGVAQETRRLFFGVRSGHAQVKALEAAESSSLLALEATQLGYSVGVRVNLDVLNAQTQLFNARRDLAKARYDVLINGLKLRQASGVLRPQDVMAVNQLLVASATEATLSEFESVDELEQAQEALAADKTTPTVDAPVVETVPATDQVSESQERPLAEGADSGEKTASTTDEDSHTDDKAALVENATLAEEEGTPAVQATGLAKKPANSSLETTVPVGTQVPPVTVVPSTVGNAPLAEKLTPARKVAGGEPSPPQSQSPLSNGSPSRTLMPARKAHRIGF